MIELDLSEAVGAATAAALDHFLRANGLTADDIDESPEGVAQFRNETAVVVEAAAPIIARQVAEQIAAEIEALRDHLDALGYMTPVRWEALSDAIRIAREAIR